MKDVRNKRRRHLDALDDGKAEPKVDSQLDCSVSNREKLDYMIEIMISNASVRTLKGRMVHEKDACHIAKKIMDLAIDVAVSEVKQNVEA